ncbi:double-strand break repair protein MRE11-like [Eriocheir sinensis]|uniref:double-strand break repair protein MRE11-like n=1 Tax=Eriocheir sinensis TaxID=95602 RepID=UPI0021C79B62|nr:double-strand break repair protein MRE11-like [Eriocheir sinensis]
MSMEQDGDFRILVATDTHLGYAEKHPERGNDSFVAFEEVLQMAVEHAVDFILLGGDLFHENKPSRHCQVRCMDLLRKYTFGDRPVYFDILSDPSVNFPHTKQVNYRDPNLNVAIPVFSIHGNHDDPSGLGFLCALEMLSSAGLINYFGRVTDLNEVRMSPILMQKGKAKLALYGLSSVKDERLHRLFVENKVKMLRPKEAMTEWFNMLVVHQNRAKRGPSNYLPESFLDPFIDLVIWGHEHDCIQEPKQSSQNFHILQPGSSVATSLCPGEALPKCAFLLQVNSQQQFKVDPLPLKTVRPFIFEEIVLSEFDIDEEVRQLKGKMEEVKENNAHDRLMKGNLWAGAKGKGGRGRRAGEILPQPKIKVNPVEVFIEQRVRELLKKTKALQTGHPKQPTLPLVRIRVVYTEEEQMFNACRFGYRFEGLVANTEDVVIFAREKAERGTKTEGLASALPDNLINVDDVNSTVEELVEEIFKVGSLPGCEMHLLTERGMGSAVTAFVEKSDKHALSNMIDHQMKRTQDYIVGLDKEYDNPDDLEADIQAFKAMRCTDVKLQREEEEFLETFQSTGASAKSSIADSDDDSPPDIGSLASSDSDGDTGSTASSRGRGRGSRGGRASTRGKTTTSTRARRGRGRI